MTTPRNTRSIKQYWEQRIQTVQNLNDRTYGWLGMVATAVRETLKPNSSVMAASIAYFALFSLFPVTLLSISIASFSLGKMVDQHLILQKLEFIAPAIGQLLGPNIDEIIEARGSVTTVALIGLIWSGSTIFYTLTHTLNEIWGIKQNRPLWKRRGLAILFVLGLVGPALFLASFASSVTANLHAWLPEQANPIERGVSLLVAILFDIASFMLLYSLLPHRVASTWREILAGAIGAGLLWELAKKAFLFFVASYVSISNLVYGSVATILAFLLWAYLSGLIFIFGGYLSLAYYQYREQHGIAS